MPVWWLNPKQQLESIVQINWKGGLCLLLLVLSLVGGMEAMVQMIPIVGIFIFASFAHDILGDNRMNKMKK